MNHYPHRWRIAAVSCIMNLCLGVNYAWSVLAGPLAQRLNEVNHLAGTAVLNAGSLAIVFSITNAILPLPMIVAGAINDRRGPKVIVFLGGLLFGLGTLLTGLVNSVGTMILTFSVMAGIGNSLVYTCTVNNTVKFFPDHKGLIGGLTTACYGMGSIVLSPLAQKLIDIRGVSGTLRLFGMVAMVVICVGSFFLAKCPQGPASGAVAEIPSGRRELNWRQMLCKPVFYVMLLLLAAGSLQGMMIISQASAVAQEMVGTSAAIAAVMVSLIAVFNTFGRLLCGYVSDKFGRINVITVAIFISLAGLFSLYASARGSIVLFAVGACMVGLCFGCFLGVFPGFSADCFGIRNNSLNYGLMFIGNSIGSIAGPSIMTRMHGGYGTYQPAFLVAAALATVGLMLAFVYRIMERREQRV